MSAIYPYLILYLGTLITSASCARILAAMFIPSYSHHLPFKPLWKQLAARGHEITLITANPLKNVSHFKNLRQIDVSGSYEVLENYKNEYLDSGGSLTDGIEMIKIVDNVIDWQLSQPEIKQLIQNGYGQFDLMVSEAISSIYLGFAERFKIPVVGINSMDIPSYLHIALGNYMHPVIYPDIYLMAPPLDFSERVVIVMCSWLIWYLEIFIFVKSHNTVARKHFGEDLRDVSEMEKDISMVLLNVNPFFQTMRPMGMNTIVMGGGNHIENEVLPQDLKNYVESCKTGIIYFSLGTTVNTSYLDKEFVDTIVTTLAKLPYHIIWKTNKEFKNLPQNIRIMKWVPQQGLLAHPNVKLFVTHGGLHSIEEAIHYHVPMIVIPFMWDQPSNAKTVEKKGIGIELNRKEITEEKFASAIVEVLGNPKYKQNIMELANLTADVEKTGTDKAVWWIEYCIRTKGAKHLRNPAADIPTYQFYFLDVISFFLVVFILMIFIFVVCMKFISRILFKKKRNTREKSE